MGEIIYVDFKRRRVIEDFCIDCGEPADLMDSEGIGWCVTCMIRRDREEMLNGRQ